MDIPTRFGTTHVAASGAKDAEPLVLLHGYMATLTMWAPNIADFSKHYRIYALDVMGQPGKSTPTEPIRTSAIRRMVERDVRRTGARPHLPCWHVVRRLAGAHLRVCPTAARSQACTPVARRAAADGQTVQRARDADDVLPHAFHRELVHAMARNHRFSR